MAQAAAKAADRALLKVKLGGAQDPARIDAVRRAAPGAELIVDANEAWTQDDLAENLAACAQAGVTLVEQPLPAGRDDMLAQIARPLPICADESVACERIARLARRQSMTRSTSSSTRPAG
jgi:L-alanine-DL-glutamate epimerase-like enolase superfamily enzyme